MRKRRSVLHSESGHRHRNYKRKMRNLFLEITLIIALIFVAINFIKKEEEHPKVSKFDEEMQKEIIDKELEQQPDEQENENNSKVLVTPMIIGNIEIIKTILYYQQESNETIIKFDVLSTEGNIEEQNVYLEILDKDFKNLTRINVKFPCLESNKKTRVNVVLDGDYRNAETIQSHEGQ